MKHHKKKGMIYIKVIKKDLGKHHEFINIYPLADVHLGSAHFEEKKFKEYLEIIEQDDNGYVILNGDLHNNAIRNGVSDIYEETMPPEAIIDKLVEYLTPIAHKVVAVTTGNHEERTYKQTGIDITKNLCYRLGIVDYYSPISNMIFLSFGKSRGRKDVRNTFSIYQKHGRGGGRTMGGKANAMHRMAATAQADIYIHSHTHTPISFKDRYITTNNANKGVNYAERLFINTHAYEGFGGYGETFGFTPSSTDYVMFTLSADKRGKKIMKATL